MRMRMRVQAHVGRTRAATSASVGASASAGTTNDRVYNRIALRRDVFACMQIVFKQAPARRPGSDPGYSRISSYKSLLMLWMARGETRSEPVS